MSRFNLRGSLLVFSGLDGAGKSTQIDLLLKRLQVEGYQPRRIWARGGYTPGLTFLKALVRRMRPGSLPKPGPSKERSQKFQSTRVRRIWLALAILDLALYYGVWARGLCWRGRVVVADRYLKDTLIDFDLNFPQENVAQWQLWRFLEWVSPRPAKAFVFTIPVAESLRRSALKNEPFPDSENVLALRLEAYRKIERANDFIPINGMLSREELRRQIAQACGLVEESEEGGHSGRRDASVLRGGAAC